MNMSQAFNEWMRRYLEEPERFEREFQTVVTFIEEDGDGAPSYGSICEGYLRQLMREKPRLGHAYPNLGGRMKLLDVTDESARRMAQRAEVSAKIEMLRKRDLIRRELAATPQRAKRPPPKKVPRPPAPKPLPKRGKFSVRAVFEAKERTAAKAAKRGGKRR